MKRRVFDEPTVRREHGLSAAEPTVVWFTDVTRPDAAAGRRLINELYARYPDQSAHTWARLHSEDDRQFLSALDELHVHHVLARRYRVEYEEGAGRQPDFRLYDNADQYVGRVEVLTLMQRKDWAAEGRWHGQLVGEINRRLPLTTHSVVFDIER